MYPFAYVFAIHPDLFLYVVCMYTRAYYYNSLRDPSPPPLSLGLNNNNNNKKYIFNRLIIVESIPSIELLILSNYHMPSLLAF